MRQLILRRVIASIFVLILASMLVFILSRASGDPRNLFLTEYTTKEDWEEWGKAMGLDKPYYIQYITWASGAVRLDFGKSVKDQIPAVRVVRKKILPTLQLAVGSYIFAIFVGVPLGIMSAVKRGSVWDLLGRAFALLGQAIPGFWLGIMLILIFSVQFHIFPTGGKDSLKSIVLPSIALGWFAAAALLRLTRSAMLEVLDSEYIKLARAKGVSERIVVWKHAFRNSIVVPLTYAGMFLTALLTGTVITETVYAWPGMGRLAVQAVFGTDFPVVSCIVMFATFGYLFMNLMVDVLYCILDPRMRSGKS